VEIDSLGRLVVAGAVPAYFGGTVSLNGAAANLEFVTSKGQHITTAAPNSDISGRIAITGGTSASARFNAVWSVPPACVITPISDPTSTGRYWVTTTTSAITANVSIPGSIVFNYICIGNSN
jgi:hypothetical protein